jgi:plastocyanin
MLRTMKRFVACGMLVFFVALPAVLARAAEYTISVRDSYYQPPYRVILTGDKVTWVVDGNQAHTVTEFDEDFDSSRDSNPTGAGHCRGDFLNSDDCLRNGDTFERHFDEPGTYKYFCKVHGTDTEEPDPKLGAQAQPCGMCGIISVRAPASVKPTSLASQTRRPTTSRRPTATATATASGAVTSTPTTTTQPAAASGGGSAGRLGLALLAISALSGAAYATWRRFIAPER